jgi:hypothetical protein
MKQAINTLRFKKTNHEKFTISMEIDGVTYEAKTDNSDAIDAAFDEEQQPEARLELVHEILNANEIQI